MTTDKDIQLMNTNDNRKDDFPLNLNNSKGNRKNNKWN